MGCEAGGGTVGWGGPARRPCGEGARPRGPGAILSSVKEKAHYEITMRPRSPRDIPLRALEETVRDCSVRCRDRPYPYAPVGKGGGVRRLERCIEAHHDEGMRIGVWRLCRSGQFKQRLGLPEARWPKGGPAKSKYGMPLREKFLEPTVTLY